MMIILRNLSIIIYTHTVRAVCEMFSQRNHMICYFNEKRPFLPQTSTLWWSDKVSIELILLIQNIYSKYFSDSDWLKAHA